MNSKGLIGSNVGRMLLLVVAVLVILAVGTAAIASQSKNSNNLIRLIFGEISDEQDESVNVPSDAVRIVQYDLNQECTKNNREGVYGHVVDARNSRESDISKLNNAYKWLINCDIQIMVEDDNPSKLLLHTSQYVDFVASYESFRELFREFMTSIVSRLEEMEKNDVLVGMSEIEDLDQEIKLLIQFGQAINRVDNLISQIHSEENLGNEEETITLNEVRDAFLPLGEPDSLSESPDSSLFSQDLRQQYISYFRDSLSQIKYSSSGNDEKLENVVSLKNKMIVFNARNIKYFYDEITVQSQSLLRNINQYEVGLQSNIVNIEEVDSERTNEETEEQTDDQA